MRNSRIVKIVPGTIFLMLLLIWCVALCSDVFAVSAEKEDFVILGRSAEDEDGEARLVDEMVDLRAQSEVDSMPQARVKSGKKAFVLDKRELEEGNFYFVSTFGRDGGMMGWVTEEYIYEVVPVPEGLDE